MGKTETAKSLAQTLFGAERAMTRVSRLAFYRAQRSVEGLVAV